MSDFDRWMERNLELGLMICALVGEHALRQYLKQKHSVALMPVMLTMLVSRLGIEGAGMYIAYLIDGKSGMDAWLRYSNRVFDDYLLVPNPVDLVEITAMSMATIIAHYHNDPRVRVVPDFLTRVARYGLEKTFSQPQFRFI